MFSADMAAERDATDDANWRNALCVATAEGGRMGVGVAIVGVGVGVGTAGAMRDFIIDNPMMPVTTRMMARTA